MSALPIQERCWNHSARAAVCRCPGCRRSFCRECVTEHEVRLLCSACVARLRPAAATPKRHLLQPLLTASGLLLAWATFYGCGQAISELSALWELRQ